MVRHKWIMGARNKIVELYTECDSCAAIEGSCLSSSEREKLKAYLEKTVKWIDKTLPKPKK